MEFVDIMLVGSSFLYRDGSGWHTGRMRLYRGRALWRSREKKGRSPGNCC